VDDGKLTVTVEDSGIGISAEELPKISEKFFRSADPRVREQPGSGLGLSLVKEVVRLHGGAFEIRSEVDKGTAVKITLPIV
jgi:signal transduction histidine kinase